ncbi:MAG: glycosyl transferase, partial [Desulfobacula sp.]|nr:glycosyl transferase [Desulfobacula sp.]
RKAFRFELDPILNGISTAELAPCLRLCSLRDILVEKTDQDKYESRILNILNNSFDGLLIHSDPEFIPLEQTFGATDSITIPTKYTGFITPVQDSSPRTNNFKQALQISREDKLVVVSIGGGNVGAELLQATAAAAQLLQEKKHIHLHLFTGPYSAPELHAELEKYTIPRLHIHNFCNNFPEWLRAADLSISMAGYNTCMNIIAANVSAVVWPFDQNREQRIRAEKIAQFVPMTILEDKDLMIPAFTSILENCLGMQKKNLKSGLNIQGAFNTAKWIGGI